jgi:two-component system, OmpR family, osmolarity sensor histidine kinase EnvZ
LNLFWRTYTLLALLLIGAVFAWVQATRVLDVEPRAEQAAQQTANLVQLARTTLQAGGSSAGARTTLLRSLETQATLQIRPREPADRVDDFEPDSYMAHFTEALRRALGPETQVVRRVNGNQALWVGFTAERERFWLRTPLPQSGARHDKAWPVWPGMALLLTLAGSALVAGLINRPLKQLSFAASRVRGGDLDSRLDETTLTSEIREVNKGFNRMARELARVEEDRAVMLAGISHDLRTPLARLRLETEMSVQDDEAKRNMAMDIDQLDGIIDKFMDYARPGNTQTRPVHVSQLIDREAAMFRDTTQIRITAKVAIDLAVMADETELGRVFQNLFENSRRYGRGTYTGAAEVSVSSANAGVWAIISVRDQGPGAAPEKLSQLTTPFFRGDAARTAATGAGLGLAIVEKAMQRMGGSLELANVPDGGLVAHLRLKRAPG